MVNIVICFSFTRFTIQVEAWNFRGRVPVPVLSTADLKEVRLKDRDPDSKHTSGELQLLYSMAIIRLVNGLVAPFHGATAAPIGVVALQLSLPDVLVDIRHQASHHVDMPSLEILREGSEEVFINFLFISDLY